MTPSTTRILYCDRGLSLPAGFAESLQKLGYVLEREAGETNLTDHYDLVVVGYTDRGNADPAGLQGVAGDPPVILLTSEGIPTQDRILLGEDNVVGTLVYPCGERQVFTTIETALAKHQNDRVIEQLESELENSVRAQALELEQLEVELESALEFKKNLLTAMRHEICTPLNAVIGFSQILAASGERESSRLRELSTRMQAFGETMLAMSDQLLDGSNSMLAYEAADIDSTELLEDLCQDLDAFTRQHGRQLVYIPGGDPFRIRGLDRHWLQISLVGIMQSLVMSLDAGAEIYLSEAWHGRKQLLCKWRGETTAAVQALKSSQRNYLMIRHLDKMGVSIELDEAQRLYRFEFQ